MSRKVLFIVGLFLFPLSACADVLVFKSGKTVEGVITDVTPTGITFESGSDILGVSYTQISEVRASEGGRVKNTLLVDKARTYLPPKRPKSGTANLKKSIFI